MPRGLEDLKWPNRKVFLHALYINNFQISKTLLRVWVLYHGIIKLNIHVGLKVNDTSKMNIISLWHTISVMSKYFNHVKLKYFYHIKCQNYFYHAFQSNVKASKRHYNYKRMPLVCTIHIWYLWYSHNSNTQLYNKARCRLTSLIYIPWRYIIYIPWRYIIYIPWRSPASL